MAGAEATGGVQFRISASGGGGTAAIVVGDVGWIAEADCDNPRVCRTPGGRDLPEDRFGRWEGVGRAPNR